MEKLLILREVAEALGVTDFTVATWAKEGKIPAIKMGHLWRFRPSELEEWLSQMRVEGESLVPTTYKKGKWQGPEGVNTDSHSRARKKKREAVTFAPGIVEADTDLLDGNPKSTIIKDEKGNPVVLDIPEVDMSGLEIGEDDDN